MSEPTQTVAREQAASEPAVRYEALRCQAMEPRAWVSRDGLVVLLREGLAAWMEAWSRVPAPPQPSVPDSCPQPAGQLAAGTTSELVGILAAMALAHIEEVPA